MKSKICKCCGEKKPLIDFYMHPGYKDNRLNICKSCMSKKSKQRYNKIKLETKQNNKNSSLSKEYSKIYCRIDNIIYSKLSKKLFISLLQNFINKHFFELAFDGIILPPADIMYENYIKYLKKNNYSEKDWIPFKLQQEFLFDSESVEKNYKKLDLLLKEIGI